MYLKTISKYQAVRLELRTAIQEYIKDTSYTLTDRWNVFVSASEAMILPTQTYIQHLPTMKNVSWYDDFHKDRYSFINWVRIAERIEDNENSEFYDMLDAIKEEILAAGYCGFTHDW